MRKRRKTPSRQELARLARRKRVADAWMAGASAAAIAKSERISVAAVYTDLQAAQDVILPGATREMLLAKNYERLEAVIRANADGVKQGDDVATRNSVRALEAENKMLGVNGTVNNNFMVSTGPQGDASKDVQVLVQFPHEVRRPDGSVWIDGAPHPNDAPIPDPPSYAYPNLKLIEHRPAEPAPFPPDPPPEPRSSKPPPPPSDGTLRLNRGGSLLRFSEYETELDIPQDKRPPKSLPQPIMGRPRHWTGR